MKNLVGNEYFQLIRRFPLRPIRSERELAEATRIIDELIAYEQRSPGADAYLDMLSDLVEKYENEHHPVSDASPVEMLQFLIEDRKTNQRAVALGSGMHVSTMFRNPFGGTSNEPRPHEQASRVFEPGHCGVPACGQRGLIQDATDPSETCEPAETSDSETLIVQCIPIKLIE
jgi:HTH-type transcriptional regulator/antitoxin HigA